ncbi:erythromycin esterase family protein [Pedobacter psychroterrae]|uniref:Erythromycin esterase n=1 Tax=Pedobacter psychroterrae TaxID=2530453 RepID=A0A4R0NQY9_9SPHI|nr:erythromycin esterase family protein [Pedobacter psychroterrae]TCD02458.1 hypothetical protein EZ437_00255 [Pedobacter psychroterrae]
MKEPAMNSDLLSTKRKKAFKYLWINNPNSILVTAFMKIGASTRFVILSVLSVTIFNALSFGQAIPPTQLAKFQLSDLTTNYSSAYLNSVFDDKIPDNVQVLALGEVSHGGYEPIAFNANMIKYLIEKKGYRKVLFEWADVGMLRAMRNYLNDPKASDAAYIPAWVKNSQSVDAVSEVFPDLLNWIKQYNDRNPKDRVEIMGFEIGKDQSLINRIVYKYLIPFDHKESQKWIYQLSSDISDVDKIQVLKDWFVTNEKGLKAELNEEDFWWLKYYIRNAVDGIGYLMRDSKTLVEKTDAANLFRDSVLAENVKYLSKGGKAIVSAHNGHVIKGQVKYMGNYLNQYFKDQYYVIATDYSKQALVDINNQDSTTKHTQRYIRKTFPQTLSAAANRLNEKYGISEAILFYQDIIDRKIGQDINAIDANGHHLYMPEYQKNVDALVIFSHIYPSGKLKSP